MKLVFILILTFFLGLTILRRINYRSDKIEITALALLFGIGFSTLLIFLLDVIGISLTFLSVFVSMVVVCLLLGYPEIRSLIANKKFDYNLSFKAVKKISIEEWFFLLVITGFFIISLWRCYYLPITPYDTIVGIDLVAKYAVEAGQINSYMFNDMHGLLSTQPYYAPFATLCQIIYRLADLPFGKVWLSMLFLSFIIIFYRKLRQKTHPVLAGLLTIILISIPEFYAYTFMVQTDFSNAVFISLAIIYAFQFIKSNDKAHFWISAILFGFGCWSRSETFAFSLLAGLLMLVFINKEKQNKSFLLVAYFIGISFLFFCIWNLYYLPHVLDYSPESYFKFGFWDKKRLTLLFNGMVDVLFNFNFWGYLPYFFIGFALINLVFFRDKENLFLLLWIITLFTGFLILLYHLQLNISANINNTFRRGSFKFWPIMVYYIGTSYIVQKVSQKITNWLSPATS